MTIRKLLLAFALLFCLPITTAGSSDHAASLCGPKKGKNRNQNNSNRNTNNRNTKPRVVGTRTGNLPPLSSKMPKHIETKPYEPPAHIATLNQDLKTYTPKQLRSVRIVGRVRRTVETRLNPHSRLEEDVEGYSLETSLGDVALTVRALQLGGQVIDLAPYVGHRIRVTGDGYFRDEKAKSGLRYEAIRRIETE